MRLVFKRCFLLVGMLAFAFDDTAIAQHYGSSVVGTNFDYITDADPSCFESVEFQGVGKFEMPDKTADRELFQPAYGFLAKYKDGTKVHLAIDAEFESEAAARKEADKYLVRLGKLPTALRKGVERLVLHRGHPDTTAFSDQGLIVVYSDNASRRIQTHDLEETLFHESVHAAWDAEHRNSKAWKQAQEADGVFVTNYARKNPRTEDLAESALFAFTLIHHPDRIPSKDAAEIRTAIRARIRFVETLLPKDEPLIYDVEDAKD